MAIWCDECRYVFIKEMHNCPFCGRRIYSDSRTNDALLNEGFHWAPGQQIDDMHNEEGRIKSIRQAYHEEHDDHSVKTEEISITVSDSDVDRPE